MSGRWKRHRGDGEEDPHRYRHEERQPCHQPRVRYSDLAPEARLQKRRQERQEKKEMERTLSYFKSVQRALEEQASGAGDASTLATIVDGFFVELIKLLKSDATLHLLRNGVVCRVIESALANSLLLHSKSLLFVLLGHVFDAVASPTASYMMETLMASLAQALSALAAAEADSFAAEMTDGGPGVHAGSGVPSAATLVTCVVEELSERAEEVILHDVAARAVRSIVLVLGGFTIRGAPPLAHAVKFTQPLSVLGVALMQGLESTFADNNARRATDMWLNVANTPTASFILQSLLRVCAAGTEVDVAVRQRLESVHDEEGVALLRHLLMDPMGCHLLQAYIKVPAPLEVLEAGDLLSNRMATTAAALSAKGGGQRLQEILRDTADHASDEAEGAAAVRVREKTCWDNALDVVMEALDDVLDPAAEHMTPVLYVLQDLVLFAPTAVHLECVWVRLLHPRLRVFVSSPALLQVLVAFARKCAFAGPPSLRDGGDDGNAYGDGAVTGALEGSSDALPKDIDQLLRADVAQGARYFAVPTSFQKTVTTTLCFAIKQECAKGAAQFLLVDAAAHEKGMELARYILHFHPSASAMFVHAVDKLSLRDMECLVRHVKGSLVVQQYLRSAAAAQAVQHSQGSKAQEQKTDKTVPMRFLRRVASLLPDLVGDTSAGYVVEVLYEVGSLEVKEALVKLLVPIYTSLRHGHGGAPEAERSEAREEADGSAKTPNRTQMREFIARKVMTKCCVELYMHRPEDWAKLARRQCQVLRLLQRMSVVAP
ncbi:uncharacterized protein Tco025E_00871 [Trypanosoma conorhini]|uniref:Uncharacterized protein n=1 Tax=Trypanosoma conorhini TaxID=83891 RepID=A0A422QAB5_9TRYP|nr:uncharacterized protein Tco025E_00871 [Trypanosoma conorhini]RNF26908.1 hypothetical protein Tco025E_00871 [Trypanosoma conorhini]